MKVAIVCPYAWDRVGGVQSHIRALARRLRARSHEVTIIAPRAGPERRQTEEGVTIAGRAVGVPANDSVAPISFGPVAARSVRAAIEGAGPDVMHLHEPLIPSLSLLALLGAEIPSVGTFHAASRASLGYRIGQVILERAASRITVRTAVSDAARDFAARYFPGDYLLTPNGVDTARFRSAAPAELGMDPVVLFVGRIEKRKGLEVLVRAMASLTGIGARLVVAGSGPRLDACRRLAASLNVPAAFVGRPNDDDLAGLYRAATVYCAPGLGGESFGMVLLEAMAADTPVVCSDLAPFRSLAAGVARFARPGDAASLADALRGVLQDDGEATRMRTAGARVAASFDWSRLVPNLEGVYARAAAA